MLFSFGVAAEVMLSERSRVTDRPRCTFPYILIVNQGLFTGESKKRGERSVKVGRRRMKASSVQVI